MEGFAPSTPVGGKQVWCVCKCGKRKIVQESNLHSGYSTQCLRCGRKQGGMKRRRPGNALKGYLKKYQEDAKLSGRSFTLTDEQFAEITSQDCHYCGQPPSFIRKNSEWEAVRFNGVDRKDNSRGYDWDNVLPCCTPCNRSKLCRSYEDHMAYLFRIVKHLSGKK